MLNRCRWGVLILLLSSAFVVAEPSREQMAWQSKAQVRDQWGEPNTKTTPVGTHAEYERWIYETFTVAFANGHVIHVFDNNSLRQSLALDENRPQ